MSFGEGVRFVRGEIFLSPEFEQKSQREVTLFLEIPEFPTNTLCDRLTEASVPK